MKWNGQEDDLELAMEAESVRLPIEPEDIRRYVVAALASIPKLSPRDVTPAGWASAGEGVEL